MAGFPEKILIIDDDPLLLEMEEKLLSRVGNIEIKACDGCDTALASIDEFVPDLILLDLMMPKKDGPETIRALRSVPDILKTPIIFVTGEHKIVMQSGYKELGVVGVIHKPFESSDFIMKIQKIWQAHCFISD